jgi:hypothetical protein
VRSHVPAKAHSDRKKGQLKTRRERLDELGESLKGMYGESYDGVSDEQAEAVEAFWRENVSSIP